VSAHSTTRAHSTTGEEKVLEYEWWAGGERVVTGGKSGVEVELMERFLKEGVWVKAF